MQAHSKRDTVIAIIVAAVIYCAAFFGFAYTLAPNGDLTVYVTSTGECYHESGCSSLRYSKYPRTLEKAVQSGYRSCNNCDPPEFIDVNRDYRVPWWAYIVFPPMIAFCAWNVSAFVLAFLGCLIRFDLDNIRFGFTFLVYIIFAIILLIALDVFL